MMTPPNMTWPRRLVVLASLMSFASASVHSADADPIKTKLDKAKSTFNSEVPKFVKGVTEFMEKAEADARKKGDKAALDRLRYEWTAFDLMYVPPPSLPQFMSKKADGLRASIDLTYQTAIKEYTKASKDDKAASLQKEFEQFQGGGKLGVRYFALVNSNSGLVITSESEKADRGNALLQMENAENLHQQWSFHLVKAPSTYAIRNRQSGHFINLGGSLKEGNLHLWDGGGGDHNWFTPTKDGKFYTFANVTSGLYFSVADASTKEKANVIQTAKGKGEEQKWELVTVRPQ